MVFLIKELFNSQALQKKETPVAGEAFYKALCFHAIEAAASGMAASPICTRSHRSRFMS